MENKAADALSRKQIHEEVFVVSSSKPRWLEIIVEGYHQDNPTKQLLTELSLIGTNDKGFSLVEGLIKYKGKIWLGNNTEAHQALFAWPISKRMSKTTLQSAQCVNKQSQSTINYQDCYSLCLYLNKNGRS